MLRSDKEEARRFQDWVARDVLPAIRKDGAYTMGKETDATSELDEDAFIAKALEIMQRKVARLAEESAKLAAENAALRGDLNPMSIDEYSARTRRIFDNSYRQRLQWAARKLAKKYGITLEKQFRALPRCGLLLPTYVNIYPRSLLEEAETSLASR